MLEAIRTTDTPGETPDHPIDLSLPESSAWLKAELKRRFPATTFRVRMSRGTAYGMASVHWTDGPTDRVVSSVVALVEGEGFDGMTDSAYHKRTATVWCPKRRAWVRPSLRLINTHRTLSDAFRRRIAEEIGRKYGVPVPPESAWGVTSPCSVDTYYNSWQSLIWRAANDRTTL